MFNRQDMYADNAKSALENSKRQQEQRKLAMLREQKLKELKQLESQLFYKKQEVERLKSLFTRLKREMTLRGAQQAKETHELQNEEHQLKETESRVAELDKEVSKNISDVSAKISKEKAEILEHQKILADLEKQKKDIEAKGQTAKRTFSESISRILFSKKRDERDSLAIKNLVDSNRKQSEQVEASLKNFVQEVTVLENKIRSLRSTIPNI